MEEPSVHMIFLWILCKVCMKPSLALRPGSSSSTRSAARTATSWRRNSASCRNNLPAWRNLVLFRVAITDKRVKCLAFEAIPLFWCFQRRGNTTEINNTGKSYYFQEPQIIEHRQLQALSISGAMHSSHKTVQQMFALNQSRDHHSRDRYHSTQRNSKGYW